MSDIPGFTAIGLSAFVAVGNWWWTERRYRQTTAREVALGPDARDLVLAIREARDNLDAMANDGGWTRDRLKDHALATLHQRLIDYADTVRDDTLRDRVYEAAHDVDKIVLMAPASRTDTVGLTQQTRYIQDHQSCVLAAIEVLNSIITGRPFEG